MLWFAICIESHSCFVSISGRRRWVRSFDGAVAQSRWRDAARAEEPGRRVFVAGRFGAGSGNLKMGRIKVRVTGTLMASQWQLSLGMFWRWKIARPAFNRKSPKTKTQTWSCMRHAKREHSTQAVRMTTKQARRQDFAAGGPKTTTVGTILNAISDVCSNRRAKQKRRVAGTTGPTAGDDPATVLHGTYSSGSQLV